MEGGGIFRWVTTMQRTSWQWIGASRSHTTADGRSMCVPGWWAKNNEPPADDGLWFW